MRIGSLYSRFTACIIGMMMNIAVAPINVAAAAFIGLGCLYHVRQSLQGNHYKQFVWTYFFWLGFFSLGFYWLTIVLASDIANLWFLMPIATIGLGGFMAFVMSGIISAFDLFQVRDYRLQALLYAFAATVAEWVLGHYLFGGGLPWLLSGYFWGSHIEILQLTSFIGIYGLSFITFLCSFLLAGAVVRSDRTWIAVTICVIGLAFIAGNYRLESASELLDTNGPKIRLVQPNIAQDAKWDRIARSRVVRRHIEITDRPGVEKITYIIWPETAIPFVVDESSISLLNAIKPVMAKYLITGGIRVMDDEKIMNSLFVIDRNANIKSIYDKNILVPFGEYIPLHPSFKIQQFFPQVDSFSSGVKRDPISLPGLDSFLPLICYEVIFSGNVVPEASNAKWLVNITNDGWFGVSQAPHQHLLMSRVRAIEEGMPLLRAANTGISAAIDSYGNVIASIPLNKDGFIDVALPKAIDGGTVFAKISKYFGNVIALISFLLLCSGCIRRFMVWRRCVSVGI